MTLGLGRCSDLALNVDAHEPRGSPLSRLGQERVSEKRRGNRHHEVHGSMKTTIALFLVGFGGWYYFIDTLSLRELTGKPSGSIETILVNVFDIDTGLTRYDLYRLKGRVPYWDKRIKEVEGIQDLRKRDEEQKRLVAEMMEDPVLKKMTRGVLGFGAEAVFSLLRAIN